MFQKKFLLSALLFLLLSPSIEPVFASGLSTPEKIDDAAESSPAPAISVLSSLTPGQLLSRRQATLTRERFDAVVGPEIVSKWGVTWDAFANIELPHDHSNKLVGMSLLAKKMKEAGRKRQDQPFENLFQEVLGMKVRMELVHLERLEDVVEAYFSQCFEGATVECSGKGSGVQLGTIAEVSLPAGEVTTFYVKTHSAGRLASQSSGAKMVDPRELFVYKILENLDIGGETHFLQRSAHDVYIATRDAGHGGVFSPFAKAIEDEEGLGKALWGGLGAIDHSPRKNDWNAVEQALVEDPIAQQFVQQTATLDIVSRLLRIHDLLNNPDNFGFFKHGEDPFILRVIDFRLSAGDLPELALQDDHFRGFLAGNGLYNYAGVHRALCFGLHDRGQSQRVETALSLLTTGGLKNLEDSVDRAYHSVSKYLQETEAFAESQEKLLHDLTNYRDVLQHNVRFFTEKLRTWRPCVADPA